MRRWYPAFAGVPPPLLFMREDKSKWRVVDREERFSQFATGPTRNSDADRVARALALSAPAIAGEGDHWSSRSERTVVEGARDAELRFRCRKFSLQEEASGYVPTSSRLLRRVKACAPSTTLLRRVVPLPRYRGGGWSAPLRGDGRVTCAKPPRRVRDRHAAFRCAQCHDQGRAPCRAQPQARSRRDRAFAGVAQGAAQFRHRRRPPRRADRL